MISQAEQEYIINALITWVAPVEKPRETLTAAFVGTSFPENLGQGLPIQLVRDAVRLCIEDGWTHNPPWLHTLLSNVPEDTMIAAIKEKLRHPPPPPQVDPLDTTILATGALFVGRSQLRQDLRFLESQAAMLRPILIVNGRPKIGKTYSMQYIDHFSYHQGRIITYRIEFDSEIGLAISPEQVACELVELMGRTTENMPLPNTNQKLHVQQLALWVLSESAQTNAQHWFMFDDFRGEQLRPDTRAFLVALSDRITTGVFKQFCRLILIGFDRAQLTVDPNKVEEESIQPCTPADIQTAISEILSLAPGPVQKNLITPLIIENLPGDQDKMAELNVRLRALLLAVSEVKQILGDIQGADYEEVLLTMLKNLPDGEDRIIELKNRLEALNASATEVAGG